MGVSRPGRDGSRSAAIAFALAFGLDQLRGAQATAWLRGLGAIFAPLADWLTAHDDALETAADAVIVFGLFALFLNVWRAFGFTALLFRGLRLLNQDMRERRRELDASAARLNQRVAALGAEADAAAKHAEATARRAGGAKPSARAPGPVFARGPEAPAAAARSFFVELGRLMSAPARASVPTPQRLVFAFDNLDALAPADSLRLIEAASAMFGPGCVGVVACDPAALASASGGGDAARRRMEKFFQVVVNAQTLGLADGGRFAARLIGSNAVANPMSLVDAGQSRLIEPLSQGEAALLTAIAPLAAGTPRGVKRFLNAYRIARLSKAPRPAVALMLAVRLSGDGTANAATRAALSSAASGFAGSGRSAGSGGGGAGRARRERRRDFRCRRARRLGRRAPLRASRLTSPCDRSRRRNRRGRRRQSRHRERSKLGQLRRAPSAAQRDDQADGRGHALRARRQQPIPRSLSAVASAVTTVVKFCVPARYSLRAICTACWAALTASICTLISCVSTRIATS